MITYSEAEEKKDQNIGSLLLIKKEKKDNSDAFKCWIFLATWSRPSKLDQHIDVIMNLLLLGIQETMMKQIIKWHNLQGAGASFQWYTKRILNSFQDLKLSWYNGVQYRNGKLGGCVSRSYLAMARLNNCFNSGIININTDDFINELETLTKIKMFKKRLCSMANNLWP